MRPAEEEISAGGPIPPSGGPLALHQAPPRVQAGAEGIGDRGVDRGIDRVVDRMIVGKNREGLPEVRLDVAVGALQGTEVRLAAAANGLVATFVAASESARWIVRAQLAELARALEGRGLTIARYEVTARSSMRRHDRDRSPRGTWEDAVE